MGKVARLRAAGRGLFTIASIASFTWALAGEARAQAKQGAAKADARQTDSGGIVAPPNIANAPRARAKQGDCAGALDGFDQVARRTVDPTIRRDRGICHEQLDHPYPAIDDYRYYLTQRPNAADAEDIRARLARLEHQVGIVREGAPEKDDEGRAAVRGSASGSVSLSLNGASASGTSGASGASGAPGESGRSLDTIEKDEELDIQADKSPLRRGTGFEIGVALDVSRYTKEALGWTELAALELRYSISRISTILLELGFAHVNSTGSASALGGGAIAAGYEARIALNPRVTDALLLGALVGYQHLAQPSNGLVYAGFFPKARIGYRHVIGPSLGLEAAADGGVALLHLTGAPVGIDANSVNPIFGLHLAMIVGF